MNVFQKVKNAFQGVVAKVKNEVRKEHRGAHQNVDVNSVPKYGKLKHVSQGTRQQKRVEWCADFMRRRGHIVPEVSPISIYYKAGNK